MKNRPNCYVTRAPWRIGRVDTERGMRFIGKRGYVYFRSCLGSWDSGWIHWTGLTHHVTTWACLNKLARSKTPHQSYTGHVTGQPYVGLGAWLRYQN